jgi:hypothetical protein
MVGAFQGGSFYRSLTFSTVHKIVSFKKVCACIIVLRFKNQTIAWCRYSTRNSLKLKTAL